MVACYQLKTQSLYYPIKGTLQAKPIHYVITSAVPKGVVQDTCVMHCPLRPFTSNNTVHSFYLVCLGFTMTSGLGSLNNLVFTSVYQKLLLFGLYGLLQHSVYCSLDPHCRIVVWIRWTFVLFFLPYYVIVYKCSVYRFPICKVNLEKSGSVSYLTQPLNALTETV